MWPEIDLRRDRAFLALAEELHFGRAGVRLGVTHARVSQMIGVLEARAGGRLFERTSRRVVLTPLGADLEARLRPAHAKLLSALEQAAASAGRTAGMLRVGLMPTTDTPAVHDLVDAFAAVHPECCVALVDIGWPDPCGPLRRGEIDVLCNWLAIEEPDLTSGPVIAEYGRVLVVAAGHRLATRDTVTVEDLAGEVVNGAPITYPRATEDALHPPRTPLGVPIRRSPPLASPAQVYHMVARGELVSPTVAGTRPWSERPGVVRVPFRDLPPLPLGLIWCTAHENERIRALARFAAHGLGSGDPGRPGPRGTDIAAAEGSELRAFLTLAGELHFARTAERLGLTPSRVSQLIRTLEERTGAPLFDRTSRRVRLTPLGAGLRDQLGPAYQQIAAAMHRPAGAGRRPSGSASRPFSAASFP
jgi:DNA-binding transcriptional LysR family regulator